MWVGLLAANCVSAAVPPMSTKHTAVKQFLVEHVGNTLFFVNSGISR